MSSRRPRQHNLRAAFLYIHERSPLNAGRWLNGIHAACDSLERQPSRCGPAVEANVLKLSLRQYLYKSHRIIYLIDESRRVVRILQVRHHAQQPMNEDDV